MEKARKRERGKNESIHDSRVHVINRHQYSSRVVPPSFHPTKLAPVFPLFRPLVENIPLPSPGSKRFSPA